MRRWNPSRPIGVVLAISLVAAACSGSEGDDATAGPDSPGESEPSAASTSAAGSESDGVDGAAADPVLVRAEAVETIAGFGGPEVVRIPDVPPIVAPDLSSLSTTGRDFDGDLSGVAGLDVVSASCSDQGGEFVYQGSIDASFFDLAADGSGLYQEPGLVVTVDPDGSGSFVDTRDNREIEILVEADGSGSFTDRSFAIDLSLVVDGDGSGVFRDRSHNNDLTVEIADDGSGRYQDQGYRMLEVEVGADGAGRYEELSGGQRHEASSEPDGSWTYRRILDNDELTLTVRPDGSGRFVRLGDQVDIEIEVDGSGNVAYRNGRWDLDLQFVTEDGILDPGLVVVAGSAPEFVVAERFPALDGLGQLRPPCVSILRLDADVLFDFDSDQLQPDSRRVVERLARALAATDVAIEIHGHSDSVGDEAYNQDLAGRRAEAFAAALREAGVRSELRTMSFGETRPVAPNESADGSDDPAGRQRNRRIEIVLPE